MSSLLIEKLKTSPKVLALEHALREGDSILVEELWNSPKSFVSALAQIATGKHLLVLTAEPRLFHDFSQVSNHPVVNFPAWETLPTENIPPSPDVVGDRYKVLQELSMNEEPLIILSSLQACLQRLIPPTSFDTLYLILKRGDVISFDTLKGRLEEMGYLRSPVAADKGEFAIRGGIIDIFPVSSPEPYRLEFFGDDIESIRIYDPVGQKSIKSIEEIEIPPAQELELLEKQQQKCTILDYLGKETIVVFDDLLALEDRYSSLTSILGKPTANFADIKSFMEEITPLQKIFFSQQPIEELTKIETGKGNYYSESTPLKELSFEMFEKKLRAKKWLHPFESIRNYLFPELQEGEAVGGEEVFQALPKLPNNLELHFLTNSELEESTLHKKIHQMGLKLPEKTHFHLGYLSSGFLLPEENIALVPMTEITHRYKIRRQKQRSTYHTVPSQAFELAPGEMIVHLNHGIGKFLRMERRPNHEGVECEYFLVEYADNGKLFVPINQSHLISKYIGSSEEIPKMHTIGSNRWQKAKENTQKAIIGYAKELLQIYAEREIKGGFSYPDDTPDMQAFEEDFPYVETDDQLQAVTEIKKNMIESKPMDRLVCGDVGYGKTEVAMRACFKAVMEGGKQVAFLVPTTVLAMQHFDNFCDRMASFPVSIGVLSRFRTPKQTRETIEKVKEGKIDVLIGTHKILSGSVEFKDLGLIVIDEEQRFGVKAKEHLKKIRAGVDCLTLSATPIPRTLYMSLIGARDMSVINTPPQDRLPITTVIAETNNNVIKTALQRELARDGQAYVIHNRVETIYEHAAHIQKLLPQARIGVCHGQMHADESDAVFHAFRNGKVDILVATTIVESGLDIPNANTIIIDRADRFGMADLYQLRGRVGRWNRRAFAYFLVRKKHLLSEISLKRLNALAESSGYGGGMKLAMRDLEIRGAGDILGTEQSGHVSSIGFHFYCKLLKRTIKALQGKAPSIDHEVKLEFPGMDARFPDTYINEVSLRMDLYQRFGEAYTNEEVDEIWNEIQDRFGAPPEPAKWLYHLTRIRIFAASQGITSIKQQRVSLIIQKGKELRSLIAKLPSTPEEFEKALFNYLQEGAKSL